MIEELTPNNLYSKIAKLLRKLELPISQKSSAKLETSDNDANSIQQKPSGELNSPNFLLSWSHYLKLMRIETENNDQIFASRYQTILPDKQTFIQLLNQGDT